MDYPQEADIVIVGSGASGAAAAWRLSSDASLNIVCIEQGGFTEPSRYPSTGTDWEIRRQKEYSSNPNVRAQPADYPVDDSDSAISIANYNGFGGSTILYSAHFPRFHPSDFKVKTLDGVAEDWPLDYQELEPYFKDNEKVMGVAGLVGDPAYPEYENLLPPVPIGAMGEKVSEGFNKLGWHWWPSYSAINTARHGNRGTCINLGPCNTGCTQSAKGSVDVTYWPIARSNGVRVLTDCRVTEVKLDAKGRASGVVYTRPDGSSSKLEASIVILACGGIGTPRLLLNSTSPAFPDGLLNDNGLVGTHLMLHPLAYTEAVFDEDLQSSLGPHGCCILSQEFYETDTSREFVRGYTLQVLRGAPPIETALNGFIMRRLPIGEDHHREFARYFNKTAGISVIAEDLPEVNNRVELDSDHCDISGMPGVKITYKLSENTQAMLKHGIARSKDVLSAAGGEVLSSFAPVRHSGWHQMGTARMGTNPQTSVVNRFGQAHTVNNLFIVDSSLFVTSGAVNPVATLQALSLWVCDNILKEKRKLLS